jgi:hypothetical protein
MYTFGRRRLLTKVAAGHFMHLSAKDYGTIIV